MTTTAIDARKLIDGLDLAYPISEAREHDPGIDIDRAVACYRDFLYVCWFAANQPAGTGVRMAAICACADPIWHEHILVTAKYRADCAAIFGPGVFLDHVPADYSGHGVSAADQAAAQALYQAAGVTPCAAPRAECVWCPTG